VGALPQLGRRGEVRPALPDALTSAVVVTPGQAAEEPPRLPGPGIVATAGRAFPLREERLGAVGAWPPRSSPATCASTSCTWATPPCCWPPTPSPTASSATGWCGSTTRPTCAASCAPWPTGALCPRWW